MAQERSAFLIDLLKASACCLIVLHHLAFYGPMTDHAAVLFPSLFEWLAAHARLAVQVFLVVGGWLAARSIVRQGLLHGAPGGESRPTSVWISARLLQRYLRLAVPLWLALVVAVVCNAAADVWMDHHSISEAPQALQIVSHVLLLQDVAGHEALSAGVWYVAIDFQLHALLVILAGWARSPERLKWACLLLLALSAFFINREASWDVAAPYFWCSYGLGVLVALAQATPAAANHTVHRGFEGWRWPAMTLAVVGVALAVDFRWRLAVALVTAALLWLWAVVQGQHLRLGGQARGGRDLQLDSGIGRAFKPSSSVWRSCVNAIRGMSRISYAVFLIHFPVSLLVNAAWDEFVPTSPWLHLLGVVAAFKLSLLAGFAFHEALERWVLPWVHTIEHALFERWGLSDGAASSPARPPACPPVP